MKVLCSTLSVLYTLNVPPYLRYSTASKYPFQHCNGTSNNDLVRDILQLIGSFTRHKGNEDWRLVEIPKQEKLSTISCCASNVTKEIGVWIPKHSIKTQNHLKSTKRHVNKHVDMLINTRSPHVHVLYIAYYAIVMYYV